MKLLVIALALYGAVGLAYAAFISLVALSGGEAMSIARAARIGLAWPVHVMFGGRAL